MSDKRKVSEKIKKIGDELIESEDSLDYIANSKARICYLISNNAKVAKGAPVLGQCEKVQEKYKWAIPCDFTITVFEPNIQGLSDEQLRMLVHHELLHIGIRYDADGEEVYSINPHTLEDFKLIIDLYGTDWAEVKR